MAKGMAWSCGQDDRNTVANLSPLSLSLASFQTPLETYLKKKLVTNQPTFPLLLTVTGLRLG